mgnify:FL=1
MHGEALVCQKLDLMTINNELTVKAKNILSQVDKIFVKKSKKKLLFNSEDFDLNISQYRSIFPSGMLPTGKPARTDLKELKKKMSDFFVNNPQYYDWDLVLDATEMYVEHFRKQGYNYMKTAGYFISKNNESELASYCQMVLDDDSTDNIKKSIYNTE